MNNKAGTFCGRHWIRPLGDEFEFPYLQHGSITGFAGSDTIDAPQPTRQPQGRIAMTLPDPSAWQAIGLTLKLAASSTLLLLLLATPLAWWLAHTRSTWRSVVQAVATLPLVLPPTVLGFYLLLLMGPDGWLGQLTQALGIGLLSFSFTGLLIGSLVFSFPFALAPIQNAFASVGRRPLEVAYTLGAKPLDAFLTVALPLAKPGFVTAAVLAFAHTVGEFGVVLMIGGNIPGQTRTVSTQIYGHVEAMEYAQAHALAALMVAFSFAVLLMVSRQQHAQGRTMRDNGRLGA